MKKMKRMKQNEETLRKLFGSTFQYRLSSAAAVQIRVRAFVPNDVLPGHRRAPQWVQARTPTVHLGSDSGKAVAGPSRSDSRYTANMVAELVVENR